MFEITSSARQIWDYAILNEQRRERTSKVDFVRVPDKQLRSRFSGKLARDNETIYRSTLNLRARHAIRVPAFSVSGQIRRP